MPYFCENCGNKDKFIGNQEYQFYGYCVATLDAEGDVEDREDYEEGDIDSYGDITDIQCYECREPVEYYTDEEYQELIKEYEKEKTWKNKIEEDI